MTFNEIQIQQQAFYDELRDQERAENTIKAYRADLKAFFEWAADRADQEITKSDVIEYKELLRNEEIKVIRNGKEVIKNHPISTINRKIITINKYLKWAGVDEAAGIKQIKSQKQATLENVLSLSDYMRMLRAAIDPPEQAKKAGLKSDYQMWAAMTTIKETGIRFNELQYFTVESIKAAKKTGVITVENKGKQRAVPVNKSLIKLLTQYCNDKNITEGYIFVTRNGNPISNEQVSRRLKRIAGYARVNKDKIHPHAFRHLFAKEYMEKVGRLDKLQSILGHSSITTTTIYTKATGKELAADTESISTINSIPKPQGYR